MTRLRGLIIFGTIAVILLKIANLTEACNEAVCGSVVTKCMLKEVCRCDVKTCSCCKACYACLSDLYIECCSCFGLCATFNESHTSLNKLSYVEDLLVPVPQLFQALTADPDTEQRWTSFTFQNSLFSLSINPANDQMENFVEKEDNDVQSLMMPETNANNCTVAYISKCTSLHKCKTFCSGMGATSLRWFHDGCCECVGQNCYNYGLNESRCSKCPNPEDEEELDDAYDDYGQNYDEYNNLELFTV